MSRRRPYRLALTISAGSADRVFALRPDPYRSAAKLSNCYLAQLVLLYVEYRKVVVPAK